MLNNKGQSLVTFVIIIPIFIFLLILVVDFGRMYLIRLELDNINYLALDYGVDNINRNDISDKINEIILKNDREIRIINNKLEENKIYIETEKEYEGYFIGFIYNKFSKIKSSYVGYLKDEKKYIERVK